MRTDSTNLAAVAVEAARELVASQYGREYLPDAAADLPDEGEERPGGPRGDPPGRAIRSIFPSRSAARLSARRVQALRPDLEADHRQPDGRRPRAPHHDHRRGRRRACSRPAARRSSSPAICGRMSKAPTIPRPSWPTARRCCRRSRGRDARLRGPGAEEPHHAAAQPLQRSLAHPGAGRDGHRPAEHLRLDHRHDPRPRVRVQDQARQRAGAHLDGVRRVATARRRTCPTWSTTSSPPRWRTSWTPSAAAR